MPAAVPQYVGQDFQDAPPGHRFRLYFEGFWTRASEEQRKNDAEKSDSKDKKRILKQAEKNLQSQTDFGQVDNEFSRDALRDLDLPLDGSGPGKKPLCDILVERQQQLADAQGDRVYTRDARTTAPLVTGMGIEHPIENGLAFLDPYGLPYLPGSSVKGVLRRAAEELALFAEDPQGWSIPLVWLLFGFDASSGYFQPPRSKLPDLVRQEIERWREAYTQRIERDRAHLQCFFERALERHPELRRQAAKDWVAQAQSLPTDDAKKVREKLHLAGALSIWDVIPHGYKKLRVDIMTPHLSAYYEGKDKASPSEERAPNPIRFITLPVDCSLRFHVEWNSSRIPETWTRLLDPAFDRAFSRLGFGAKTAVGYGRLQKDDQAERRRQAAKEQRDRERKRAALSPAELVVDKLHDCGRGCDRDRDRECGIIDDIYQKDLDSFQGEEQRQIAAAMKEAYQRVEQTKGEKWPGKSNKQKAKVVRLKAILGES